MPENGAAGFAPGEDGEDAHAAATGVANQDIDGEHAIEQVGPGEPTVRGGMGLIGSGSVYAPMVPRRGVDPASHAIARTSEWNRKELRSRHDGSNPI